MAFNRKRLLSSSILAGLAAAALGPPALAQTSPAPAPDDPAEVEAVIVTGSRIRRNEFTSPDPIQIINAEQARLKGVSSTAGLLQSSTVASGSPQLNAQISSAFVTDGGPGSETVSLRGLGANRTLVLLNGRRAGPAGTKGGVSAFDLNVLPQVTIDRVEILKDGASSIYGSDAVAGVVNIITKRDTDGVEFDAFTAIPERRGGAAYQASANLAKSFDRGFASVTVDYYKKTVQRMRDRDATACGQAYIFEPTTGARRDAIDPRTASYQCRDLLYDQIWLYDFTGAGLAGKLQYDYSGQIGGLLPRTPPGEVYPGSPEGFYAVGYSDDPNAVDNAVLDFRSPFFGKSSLSPRVERSTVYAQGEFELNNSVTAYGEMLLNRRTSKTDGYRQIWTYLYTADGGDPFSDGFTGEFILSPTIATDRSDSGEDVRYQRYVGGLKGDFGGLDLLKGWDWDLYVQHSHSDGRYGQDVVLDDALKSAEGRSDFGTAGLFNPNSLPRAGASCVGLTTPISGRPCVDLAWVTPNFLAGQLTAAEEAFLFDYEVGQTIYKQTVVEGSVSGELFALPAGRVGAAFGAQYRKDSIKDTPGAVTLAGNAWGSSGAGITQGDDTATDLYGELAVPLLKDLPLVRGLDLSLSGRYTDVDSYGSDSTYKVGLNWRLTDALRLRASRGTSFRAPALFELYKNAETSFQSQRVVDPCIRYAQNLAQGNITQRVADNCAADGVPGDYTGQGASVTITSAGGAGTLEAETSKATTYGLIWTPLFADLNVAVDYFEITVKDEVERLTASQIVSGCYRSTFFPTDPLCGLFVRNPGSHLINDVTANYLNIAEQKNRGIDLTVTYGRDLPWDTRLGVALQSTWQLKDTTALFADTVEDHNGFVGDPDFTAQLNISLTRGGLTGFWGIDFVGKTSDAEKDPDTSASGLTRYKIHTEAMAYHSFSLRHAFDKLSVLVGVSNAFDEAPPAVTLGQGSYETAGGVVNASQYDYLGRRFFLSLNKRF